MPDRVQLGVFVEASTDEGKPGLVHSEERRQLLFGAIFVKDVKDDLLNLKRKA